MIPGRLLALVLLAVPLLAGACECGCAERYEIVNVSGVALDIDLAKPHPSYEFSAFNACHYRIRELPPGASWSSARATRDERAELEVTPSGLTLVRFRETYGSLPRQWRVFTVEPADRTRLELTPDASPDATTLDGEPLDIAEAGTEWFLD